MYGSDFVNHIFAISPHCHHYSNNDRNIVTNKQVSIHIYSIIDCAIRSSIFNNNDRVCQYFQYSFQIRHINLSAVICHGFSYFTNVKIHRCRRKTHLIYRTFWKNLANFNSFSVRKATPPLELPFIVFVFNKVLSFALPAILHSPLARRGSRAVGQRLAGGGGAALQQRGDGGRNAALLWQHSMTA